MLALFLFLACPPPPADTPETKAPATRGYSFMVCAKLVREVSAVKVRWQVAPAWNDAYASSTNELTLQPTGSSYCASMDDLVTLDAGIPLVVYIAPDDMTLVRDIRVVYPSPEYRDDDSEVNRIKTISRTNEQGWFVFVAMPEPHSVPVIRMGTVRPGEPLTNVFSAIEKPAEDPIVPPPAPSTEHVLPAAL